MTESLSKGLMIGCIGIWLGISPGCGSQAGGDPSLSATESSSLGFSLPTIAFYKDTDYRDPCMYIVGTGSALGCFDMGQMTCPNDSIRSVSIPATKGLNYEVWLFLDAGLRGGSNLMSSSQAKLYSWDKQTSGICAYQRMYTAPSCGWLPCIPPSNPPSTTVRLTPGLLMFAGDKLWGSGSKYHLDFQYDRNLVLYPTNSTVAVWATGTDGSNASWAIMQTDGNFVLYASDWTPLWSTGTWNNPGAYMQVEADGTLSVYSAKGVKLWSTG